MMDSGKTWLCLKPLEPALCNGSELDEEANLNDRDEYFELVDWLIGLFYFVSTLFGPFNAELNFKQLSIV